MTDRSKVPDWAAEVRLSEIVPSGADEDLGPMRVAALAFITTVAAVAVTAWLLRGVWLR